MITRRHLIRAGVAAPFVLPSYARARRMCPILCGGGLNGSLKPYLGQIATRAGIAGAQGGSPNGNSRSMHIARDTIAAVQVLWGGFFAASGACEFGVTGTITYTASIEYPAGTFQQLKFAGSTSGACLSGTTIASDMLTLSTPIPVGSTFFVRSFQVSTANILFGMLWFNQALGDAFEFGSGLSDRTMSGSVPQTNPGVQSLAPIAILGMTTKPSVLCTGDSRTQGTGDSADASGNMGITARGIGPSFAYSNMGMTGSSALTFAAGSNANTKALAPYFSHVISGWGVNDIAQSRTLAQIQANLATIYGFFPNAKILQHTILPDTSSSDGWATPGNQTSPSANFPLNGTGVRDTLNTWIRTMPAPLLAFIESTLAVETGSNTDIWKSPGFTADGLHPTQAGYLAIAPTINTSLIHRP